MYQALYRKWRPKNFDDVVGQAHISETLKRQVVSGRLSHAYLFVGTRGTGKTTCAKILSRAINCKNPREGNPCNTCSSCLGIENGSIMDVLELDAASNNGVDNVRALREEAVFTPVDVKKRVYIIDEVHMLSTSAFNALLKILEEPPAHLIFILATTEIHKVPATIMSRCQRFTFKRILPAMITDRLRYIANQENIGLTEDAAALLARLSDGSLRDALSLLDQCASDDTVDYDRVLSAIGLAGSSEIAALLSAVAEKDITAALNILDTFYMGGKVMASVLEELTALVRDVLLTLLMPKGGAGLLSGGFEQDQLQDFAKRFTAEELLSVMDILRETAQLLSKSAGGKLDVELGIMRLCDQRFDSDHSTILPRLTALEDKLKNGTFHTRTAAEPASPFEKSALRENIPAFAAPLKTEPSPQAAPIPQTVPMDQGPAVKEKAEEKAASQKLIEPAGDVWKEILSILKHKIDPGPFSFISDTSQAAAIIENAVVTVKTKNEFISKIINVPAVTDAIKDAAMAVMNKTVTVRIITEGDISVAGSNKLDAWTDQFSGFVRVE